ncbi:AAA family ATPase [Zobellia galactanivorans]|uniref:GumC family protein n=1 Tax=Zobellia galactanivorans (strain DSM 12802 / CCUG 47099 / CIP 106680 / NCIMB 13871 / Dsij) TaxID=63186 RepID=UPI0026E420AE|nr:polysaccharide biosynthesis tyrosine autokinase [Zobellia galactanivorans]MDO6809963.1 AAA family ATPase [Zobellia galactanivorans]
MKEKKNNGGNSQQEVDFKAFLLKIYKNKFFFLLSIGAFVFLALIYIAVSTPVYEASTSILIDSKGKNRVLGDSEYVEGGVSLIEVEKNLFNEIGIIKSFSLIKQTVKDLNFDVTYHSEKLFGRKEHYGYFPFKVTLNDSAVQLYGVPFEITILSDSAYKLSIEADDFVVSNPSNGSKRVVERSFDFEKEFAFGQAVEHEFFSFTLTKPSYEVNLEDFSGADLSFVVHDVEDVAKNYMSSVEANNIDIEASIFKIVSTGTNVNKEVDFLNMLTKNYIQNELGSRNEIAAGKESFIRNQLRIISDSLSKFEVVLEEFKRNRKAVDLSATASNALDQTNDLQVEAAKLRMNINFYNSVIKSVENNRNSDEFIMPSGIGIEDPLINRNILDLKQLYTERSKKRFYVTSNNQEMTILNQQVQEATEVLLSNLKSAVRSSQIALGSINSRMSRIDSEISSLPTTEIELLNIQRQSTLYENLFKYLSQELAKTGIARAESTSDTRVLDEARMEGDGPVAPQKSLLLALAVTLGMLVPLGKMIFFPPEEAIDNIGQIIANSEIPVIASIVHYDEGSENEGSDVDLWKLKESFRDLCAKLKLVNSSGKGVIGITSILPEEGKTYNAINLGITLAESGKKVIVVDADLRNPSLVGRLSEIKGKGLASYLNGELKSHEEITYSHEKVTNLKFIPTSIVEANVHELLSGNRMNTLVGQLRQEYDYVILDTPAVGLVSDFLLLLDDIDINLFVVRRNISKVRFLEDLEDLIPQNKHKKSYIIFNDAPRDNHKYGYGSKYGVNEEEQLVSKSLSV